MTEASFFLSPLLTERSIRADFVERIPQIPTSTDKEETLARLQPAHEAAASALGFHETYLAEQVHGSDLAIIKKDSPPMSLSLIHI